MSSRCSTFLWQIYSHASGFSRKPRQGFWKGDTQLISGWQGDCASQRSAAMALFRWSCLKCLVSLPSKSLNISTDSVQESEVQYSPLHLCDGFCWVFRHLWGQWKQPRVYRGKIREINLDNSISLFIWALNSELSNQKDQCQTKCWKATERELGQVKTYKSRGTAK